MQAELGGYTWLSFSHLVCQLYVIDVVVTHFQLEYLQFYGAISPQLPTNYVRSLCRKAPYKAYKSHIKQAILPWQDRYLGAESPKMRATAGKNGSICFYYQDVPVA